MNIYIYLRMPPINKIYKHKTQYVLSICYRINTLFLCKIEQNTIC